MPKNGKKGKAGKRRPTKRLSIKKELIRLIEDGVGKLGARGRDRDRERGRDRDRPRDRRG